MSSRTNNKSSRQPSPKYSPVNSYKPNSGTSATRLSGGSDYLQSHSKLIYQMLQQDDTNYYQILIDDRKCSLDLIEAINRIQQGLVIHGEKFSLTKVVVITDGISLNVDDERFFNSISRTVKPVGFSCHILLTGKSQLNKDNQFGFIVDEDMLRFISSKMNGEFHFLQIQDEISSNNKTKHQYAYFACCKSPQKDFSNMIKYMLMTWNIKYNLKEFRYSFFTQPHHQPQTHSQSQLQQLQVIDETSIKDEKDEEQCLIIYTEESKDEYCLKFKKLIKMCHRYDLKPHFSPCADQERLYQITKMRNIEGWKLIRVQRKDNFILGYEYRVNLQAKLYYLIKCVNYRYKIVIFQDVPAIPVKDKRDQSTTYKTPEYILNICKRLEVQDLIAFNVHNLMQYNFEKSNQKQTKLLYNQDQVELWEKYFKVQYFILKLFYRKIFKNFQKSEQTFTVSDYYSFQQTIFVIYFKKIQNTKGKNADLFVNTQGKAKNKFSQEIYERVSLVADKNITKNKFYLKVNKDNVHLLEEHNKDKQILLLHQQSVQPNMDKQLQLFPTKGLSVDENLMDYGKFGENSDSESLKHIQLSLQQKLSQGPTAAATYSQNMGQSNPIKSLTYIKINMKNFYVTEIKLAFQNFPKDQQKQLVKDIKKTIHHYNFEFFDISVISNSINLLLFMGQLNISTFQEASNLSRSWQWTSDCIHDLKHFYSVLVSLRKNGQFKSIQLNKTYKETVFLTEVQYQRSENTKKIKRILIAHIITFKKNLIEVKVVCENALDLIQIPGKGYQTAQKVLSEEKIMKRLYTVHAIHRHAIAKRKDSNNHDAFVQIVLDSLKNQMIAQLNMGISMLRDETENMKDISSYKKHLENTLKEEYQKFDVTKENYVEYNALFQNSYLKKTFTFAQIEGETQQDQEKLKQYNFLFYQRCLEYIQQNNDHSVINSKKNYLIDIKDNVKGYITCKFLDYKIILLTFLQNEEISGQESIDLSKQISSTQSQSNNTIQTQAHTTQISSQYANSPQVKTQIKDVSANSFDKNRRELKQKEDSFKKIDVQQQQNTTQLSTFSQESQRKSQRLQFKIDFYLMDIKACENNTSTTSRDFEKYHKGVDQYIEQLTKQINQFYSHTCFEVIATKQIKLIQSTVECAIHNTSMQPQIQYIPLKEFLPIYTWFHKDFATQKKKNTANVNTNSMNTSTSMSYQGNSNNRNLFNSKLQEDELLVEGASKNSLNLQNQSAHSKKYDKEINPIEQFENTILSKAQKVFDIVINHFFSNIPNTPYFFTDQKKQEELRRNEPNDYDLAMEFLPNINQTIPKIFLKIKYNIGAEQKYFSSLKETFDDIYSENIIKDKDNYNIFFEFYQIQNDLFKDSKQQIGQLGIEQPQTNTATKKANNFFFDFKLACLNIIKVIVSIMNI